MYIGLYMHIMMMWRIDSARMYKANEDGTKFNMSVMLV